MAETPTKEQPKSPIAGTSPTSAASVLGSATYEVIRQRLQAQGAALGERMGKLDAARQEVTASMKVPVDVHTREWRDRA